MTQTLILYSRAVGQVVSWPVVALVVLLTEVCRQVWTAAAGTWTGQAGLPKALTQEGQDRAKARAEGAAAAQRREARAEVDRRKRRQVGAIIEG